MAAIRKPAPRVGIGLLLALLILGCWLRVAGIGAQSLWFDEVFSERVATDLSVGSIIRDGVAGDVHPPLYFVALNLWEKLAGHSAVSLRLLSAFCMMLALPAVYHLGRLLFDARVGALALALGAIATFQTYYAQEARQYAPSVLFGAWSLVGLIALVRGRRNGLALYVAATVAGLYSHYFNALAIAVAHLWLLAYAPARRRWRAWLAADVVIAILFLPQAFIALNQAGAVLGAFWITKPGPAQPITTTAFLLYAYTLPNALYVIGVVLPILALALSGFDLWRRAPRRARPAWALCWLLILGVLVPIQIYSMLRTSIYLDRSFAFLSPVLLVLLASGVSYARRPSPTPALIGLLIVLLCYLSINNITSPNEPKRPYGAIVAAIRQQPAPVLHLHDESYLPMAYYGPELTQRLGDLQERSWLYPRTWAIFGIRREPRAELDAWLDSYQGGLWMIAQSFIDPAGRDLGQALLARACSHTERTYNPDTTQPVTVYYLTLGGCGR